MDNFPCGHPRTHANSVPNGSGYRCRECGNAYQREYVKKHSEKYTRGARLKWKRKYSAALADVW